MGVEGQYHWLLQLVIFISLSTTILGIAYQEEGHQVVRCDGKESLHRAKALVNIQFSWFLILLAVFAASFYVFMIKIYGDIMEYSLMALSDQQEEDVEARKIGGNFTETRSFVSGTGNSNNKAIDHMER
uniref:Uncharacterized protein n=1 Tax=Chenopodium quinoa TaxID=63459 RepID=A0A803KLX3_CHEQI